MSVLASIRASIPPVHREGHPFVGGLAALGGLALIFGFGIGWWLFGLAALVALFFRDPPRIVPLGEGLVLAPADGRVVGVGPAPLPAELDGSADAEGGAAVGMVRISIFLSVLDVHVNRMPVSGRVIEVRYTPGLFLNADLDKASEDNERNAVLIETPRGLIGVVQIAGLIARRIVSTARVGQEVAAGERFGLIRFGSRCDVYLPARAQPLVGIGQRVVGGETILADLADSRPRRNFRTE